MYWSTLASLERNGAGDIMAYSFSTANTPATGAVAMYLLKTTLVTAGWSVVADSDGSTYNSGGGQVTTGAAGAGGLGNTNAWIRFQAPIIGGNTREITIQRGTTNLLWRIKYSANANFTGGSPGVSQTASATDEVYMTGGGTDASPTFTSIFIADGGFRWHLACGGVAEFYSFAAVALTSTTTTIQYAMGLDVLQSATYPSQDIDPAVMFCSTSFAYVTAATNNSTNPANARAWLGPVSAAGASLTSNNVNVGLERYTGVGGSVTLAANPFSGKDTLWSPHWLSTKTNPSRAPIGVKGLSTLFKLGSVARTNLDTITSVGTRDLIYLSDIWLPWDGSVPVL